MSQSRRARRIGALLIAAAVAAPVAYADDRGAPGLDVTKLPCAPSCAQDLGGGGFTETQEGVAPAGDTFDWGDAGVGAGVGVAAMLAAMACAFEARRHRAPA